MQPARTYLDVEYPESDGKPMAETELHMDWMIRIREILRWRYRGQRVYVGCNMLMYFEQGNPRRRIAPDVFVAFDMEPGRRRTWKTWEEGKPPDVVFEVTSRSTRREDEQTKPQIYAEVGVEEYFLYDPTADYLSPPLQGYRLEDGQHRRLEPDAAGALSSQLLKATLRLVEGQLALHDAATGEALLTEAEAKEKERAAEKAAREAAEAKCKAAEANAAAEKAAREEAEAMIARLQEELKRAQDQSP